ncbi:MULTISPECIES: dynamin family protein [unclassified Acinetobacter]|uniref:dynamin family protein n=1 Tax=unclassified Acinetobacter TaxID=196816 RepID=UPI002446D0DF|nr:MULTISPECIES: dynamin family protein [unclassified Acinetobacter]MDH0033072.1 dynamin family protein [Acinetobacter sp. GD04021]MDH0888432.1 dynamin family protein [Acinetobacter sp. GD03873]MDH1084574.1 dynamin family protein [Acinetobacter sp. GD03983]MDH2191523.1 dynamin family protein [Acinetobacter sp. GD03645]MDH2205358.1 dynamin family protein [Acinetobacter sp. GD03647]
MSDIVVGENKALIEAFDIYKKITSKLSNNNLLEKVRTQNSENNERFKQAIHQSIVEIKEINTQLKQTKLEGKAKLFKDELKNFNELIVKLDRLEQDMEFPYMLYVIGMGKAGKSSLLNSLVGSKVADVGTLPKTWKTDLFYKNDKVEKKSVRVRYRNGEEKFYTEQEAKKLIEEEEKKREDSEEKFDKEFRNRSKVLNTPEEKSELRRELQNKLLYRSEVYEVRWGLNKINETSILNKFSLIDTPGLSQAHAGTHGDEGIRGENVSDFYYQADGVLWVLDATTLSAITPKKALENLEQSLANANTNGKSINNIIAVLNHADKVIEQGGEETLQKVVRAANNIFENKFLDVVPYSAKQAVEAIKSNDQDLLDNSGYNRLCAVVNRYFYYNAVDSRITSKLQGFRGEISTYQKDFLNLYLLRLAKDLNQLEDRLNKAEKDLDSLQKQFKQDWEIKFSGHVKKIENMIDFHAKRILDMSEKEREKFIEESIFRLGELKTIQEKYSDENIKKLSDTVERYLKQDETTFSEYKYVNVIDDLKNNHNGSLKVNTSVALGVEVFDVGGMLMGGGLAMAGLALLGPIGLAAGLLGFLFGKSKEEKAKESMKENLETLKRNCNRDVEKFITTTFTTAHDTLRNHAERAFTSLHAGSEQTKDLQKLFAKLDAIEIKDVDFQRKSFAHLLFKGSLS